MNQAAPVLKTTGSITITASNRAQQRGPHGAFRYFGKLPPDVTGAVLDVAAELTGVTRPIVDLMCGSGTTLVEAAERGWASIGFDVNPVAALYAAVKTRAVDVSTYEAYRERVLHATTTDEATAAVFGAMRNSERWFSDEARAQLAAKRIAIAELPDSREKDALLAALLGRVRRISNASERTGRIFFDPASAAPPLESIHAAFMELLPQLPSRDLPSIVQTADARDSGLPDASTDLCFCHPPYFALYRFSSDVLRFELEVGGFDRRAINRSEVREGWKSGDVANLDHYVSDMGAAFAEARRITRVGGVLAVVVSNSTLGDQQLPVVDRLADTASGAGWDCREHLVRPVHFASASYHRSARVDKAVSQDHVMLFAAR
jgi:SAM-dependent methyltransferase